MYQIKRLYILDILKWGKHNTDIELYLPTYKYIKYPNCDWLWNVLNSLNYYGFLKFVKQALKDTEKQC